MLRQIVKQFGRNLAAQRSICTTSSLRKDADAAAAAATILVEKDSNITLIGINREESRNAIDAPTAQKLCEAIHAFESDETSPVAVLYGVGGSFCAGYDLTELEDQAEQGSLDFLLSHEGSVGPTRRQLQKTIVCGINGFCVASGLELALMCDLRVMEDTAVLGFFNRRLGVPISDGGTVRLASAVGYSRALDLIATGRRVGGKEALEMGLVNRLVATGTALGQAVNLAFSIAKFPPASMLHDRNSLLANGRGRNGFRNSVQNEITYMSTEVLQEMRDGVQRFKKCASTNSWNVKEPTLADWEKEEIAHEERYAKEIDAKRNT